ncbi:hypothetical protein SPRG_04768 [Saprolegnia parasitica CBS 223.65]|uniref:Uncharacterized protein n=1 Tax=Saprolegnia parasitica (strain CBS 223.65) TaxID=695850 RepID=A0A067CWG2_SAPPC|nr:hypothetical protein SPRG_04768 [Saprolegnia parasitica CBS 223.65]KDO30866.1 hypothetical protein SPRG_04768 [Saprolegnia parasitica CBS 223.65]|eukprot:XP_012198561.1 hypothetical protein SPRG_04768 [Saprolegnia parasitica CBS 223.65]
MAQRARLASASVLDVDDILVAVVQYSASPKDVVALVRAMPLSVRTPVLAALLSLLTLPRGAKHWPQPHLNSTTIAEIDCISAAMPVFNSVCIDGVCCSTQWPASDDPAFRLPYCKFVVAHAAKMTMVVPAHREELCRMLARCTSLRRVRIPAEPDLLEAVTSLAHCVADLDLSPCSSAGSPLAMPVT